MTSAAKSNANRRNAAKSTGPRSAAGKAKVAQNGRRHGLNTPILEDPAWRKRPEQIALALSPKDPNNPSVFDYAKYIADLDRLRMVEDIEMNRLWGLVKGADYSPLISDEISSVLSRLGTIGVYKRKLASRVRKAREALEVESPEVLG